MAEQIKEREEMMSDRLTRLIDGFVFGSQIAVNSIEWNSAKVKELADYLIANGVIVPPCKVGDMVYYITGIGHNIVKPARIKEIIIGEYGIKDLYVAGDGHNFENSFDIFFLTREEAEKDLKDRSGEFWKV